MSTNRMQDNNNRCVKAARFEDVEELIKLTKDIPKVYGMDKIAPYNYEKTRQAYLKSIQNNLCFLSKDTDGKIISVLKISIRYNWWSEEPFFSNDILYASKGKFKYKLLKEYANIIKYISKKNNIPFIFDMINYDIEGIDDINKKEKMFLKLFKGSKKIGSSLQVG